MRNHGADCYRSTCAACSSQGAVTAELAIGFVAIVAVLSVLLAAVGAGLVQLRVEEAARAAAREVARGESYEGVSALVRARAGEAATVDLVVEGEQARVTARAPAPGPIAAAAGLIAEATASVRIEQPR